MCSSMWGGCTATECLVHTNCPENHSGFHLRPDLCCIIVKHNGLVHQAFSWPPWPWLLQVAGLGFVWLACSISFSECNPPCILNLNLVAFFYGYLSDLHFYSLYYGNSLRPSDTVRRIVQNNDSVTLNFLLTEVMHSWSSQQNFSLTSSVNNIKRLCPFHGELLRVESEVLPYFR